MLNLIVAPYDEAENAEKHTKRIVSFLKEQKIEYAVYFNSSLDGVTASTQEAISAGETEFVVVGNDATISAFVNAVKDLAKVKFGIVPTSANDDFAKFLGLNSNPIQAIKDILLKQVEPVDYLLCNNIKVVNNITIGASVEVFEKFSQHKVKNFITQKISTMQYGNNFEGVNLKLDFKNNKNLEVNVFELAISNGGYAMGKKISPLANVQDGLFNLNYASIEDKNERKKYLALFNKGEHIYKEATNQFWLDSLKISQPENKIKALIDGRIFNLQDIAMLVVEGGLKIYKTSNEQPVETKKAPKPKKQKIEE